MRSNQGKKVVRRFVKSHAQLIAALAAAVCCGRSRALADTWTWSGNGGDGFWSDGSNWSHTSGSSNSATPVSSDNTIVDFAGSANPDPNQNIASPFLLNSLGINSGAPFFDFIGSALDFENSSTSVAPTIVQNSSNDQEISETVSLVNTTTVSGVGIGEVGFLAPVTGAGGLIVSSGSTIGLVATNTYSGGTTLNGGQIFVNNNKALGGGTLTFNSGTITAVTNNVLLQNTFTNNGGAITFQAATGITLTFNPTSGLFGTLNFGGSGQDGTVNFEPATFSYFGGQINVNGGTLLDGADALSQILSAYGVSIASSATFNINGFSTTINDLTGAGTLATGANSSETFTLQAANFSGTISGSGKLVTTGGTVILSGANTYSGGTALNGGLIGAGNASAFGASAVSVGGNVNLYAASASQSLSNAISIASGKSLTIVNDPNGAQSLSLTGNISGSGSLVMNGTGNLTLNGTNSFSGGTTLNSGQLIINNNNALGNASGTLTLNGGTLTSTANVTENNTFTTETATAPVTFEAAAGTTLALDGTNFIGNETLNFGSSTDTGTISYAPNGGEAAFPIYNVNGGLLFDGFGDLAINLASDTLTIAQIATVNLNGNSTNPSDLTGAGTLVTGTNPNETLTLQAANFSGKITGSGNLEVAGGTIVLSGTNTYTGGTLLDGGLLSIGSNKAISTPAATVIASTNISAAVGAQTLANPISINSGQTLTVVSDPAGNHHLVLNGNISGSGALAMNGIGILTLNGTNSYSGGTTLNNGQIVIDSSSSLGNTRGELTLNTGTITSTANATIGNNFSDVAANPVTIQAATGTTLTLGGADTLSTANVLTFGSTSDTGTINFDAEGLFIIGSSSGEIHISGGTLADESDLLSFAISQAGYLVSIDQSAGLVLNNFSATIEDLVGSGTVSTGIVTDLGSLTLVNANFSGVIGGGESLVIAGGTVILSGTNTYYGGTTTISSATVGVGSGDALGDSSSFQNGLSSVLAFATNLYAAGADQTLANPISTFSGGSLTIIDDPNGAHNLTLTGSIGGGGALVMSGSGTLSLNGTNRYSGGTTLNSGQVNVNNNSSLGTGPLIVNGGALLATSTALLTNNFTFNSVNPVVIEAATGTTLTFAGASGTFNAADDLNFGSANDTGTIDISPSSTVINGGEFGEANAGGVGVFNAGAGVISPSGANFGDGQLNVLGGTLLAGNASLTEAISQEEWTVFIGQSATLNLGGNSVIIADLLGSGTLATGLNSSVVFNLQAGNFSGNITGTGHLLVTNNNVVLSGVNTYTSGTTVNSGELQIAAATALPDFPVSVGTGGTLQLISGIGSVTVPSLAITGSGRIDLQTNAILINYGTTADPVANIASYLATGYAGGAWNGIGIHSSSVAGLNAGQSALIYSIGYADGSDGITGVPPGEIEILPTLAGDAKMQGNVVFGDFQLLSQYFGQLNTTWDEGNFSYGSSTNFGDFQLLSQNFGANASGLTAGEMASLNGFASQFGEEVIAKPDGVGFSLVSVPEPTSIGLMLLAGSGLLTRRRRSKN